MGDKQTITRKVQIIPVGDKEEVNRAYKYIRDAQYAQNRAYNILISSVYSAIISGKSKEEIAEIYTRGQRKPKEDDPEYSLYGGQAGKPPGPCVRADESVFLMEWDEHLWARLRLPASC